MQKLNVEMARLNGWVHSKEEAAESLGLTEKDVEKYWSGNLKIGIGDGTRLLGLSEAI